MRWALLVARGLRFAADIFEEIASSLQEQDTEAYEEGRSETSSDQGTASGGAAPAASQITATGERRDTFPPTAEQPPSPTRTERDESSDGAAADPFGAFPPASHPERHQGLGGDAQEQEEAEHEDGELGAGDKDHEGSEEEEEADDEDTDCMEPPHVSET